MKKKKKNTQGTHRNTHWQSSCETLYQSGYKHYRIIIYRSANIGDLFIELIAFWLTNELKVI